jgi:hypothetical protein
MVVQGNTSANTNASNFCSCGSRRSRWDWHLFLEVTVPIAASVLFFSVGQIVRVSVLETRVEILVEQQKELAGAVRECRLSP